MRILILGKKGMLASCLARLLQGTSHQITSLSRPELNVTELANNNLNFNHYDYAINAIGLTNRYLKQAGEKEFWQINRDWPLWLANQASQHSCRVIHISTDCVFNGQSGLYDEHSALDAQDIYGISKAAGESTLALNLRCSMIGPEEQHFHGLLCWFLAQQQRCNGYENHLWNGMTTLCLAKILLRIIEQDLWQPNTMHIHSDDISKYQLLCELSRVYQKQIEIVPTAAPIGKDMRLRSQHGNWLAKLEIPPLLQQLEELPNYTDSAGRWR